MQYVWNWLLDFLSELAYTVLSILPDSPIQKISPDLSNFSEIMSWINYFIPIANLIAIMSTYLSAVLIYYAARWILRLTQYID